MQILFNNKFIKENEAKISMLSESFMHGYGVFETLRTYEKKIFKLKEHIDRLLKSAKHIELEINFSKKEIIEMTEKISQKSPHKNQKIKIIAIKEGILIQSTKLSYSQKIIEKGVKCKTIKLERSIPEIKSISYIESKLSHKKAKKENYYEAILIGKNKEVYEGAYSNIFWIEKEKEKIFLCTRKEGILQGITRQTIIKISPYPIRYKNIKINELLKKPEVFLSQTLKGIVPITQIDKTKIGNGEPGKHTKEIIELFNKKT